VTSLALSHHVLTPNGDGTGDSTDVSFSLSSRASVAVEVLNSDSNVVRTLASSYAYRTGRASLSWNGRNSSGHVVRDGHFRIRITASSPGQEVHKARSILVDRTLGHLDVAPALFSPNRDGRLDATTISFKLSRDADVRVRVMDGDRPVAVVHRLGAVSEGSVSLPWDGGRVADGSYRVLAEATTSLGTRSLSAPLIVDTRAPTVRVVWAHRRKDGSTNVKLWLSEAAAVRLWYGRPEWREMRSVQRQAGYAWATLPRATRVRAQAVDAAANVGPRAKAHVRS
jgi:flagellar hook assembly protein FlgD